MNAPVPPPALSLLAHQNIEVLQALTRGDEWLSVAALATHLNRDKSNLAKTLTKLADEHLVTDAGAPVPVLTEAGRGAVAAWERAQGGEVESLVVDVPLNLIDPWDGNPRKHFDPETLEDLARSIADKGVRQPIEIRAKDGGRFEVMFGERRRRASLIALARQWTERHTIPARIVDISDEEAEEVAATENIQRDDMHWFDLAEHFRHMMDVRHRSGPQLERLYGRRYSARKIQDYAKVARELPKDRVPEVYLPKELPDGKPNPACLTYVKARDEVGEKKEKPALTLSPKLAIAFLEAIHAGLARTGQLAGLPKVGTKIVTRFHKAWTGGPFATLSNERQLITFKTFEDFGAGRREPAGTTIITDDIARWLQQIGWAEGADVARRKILADFLGDMVAAAYVADGKYFTAELNPPDPPKAPELSPRGVRKLVEIGHKAVAGGDDVTGEICIDANGATGDPELAAALAEGLIFVEPADEDGVGLVGLTDAGEAFLKARGLLPNGEDDCPALARAYAETNAGHVTPAALREMKGNVYQTTWMTLRIPEVGDDEGEGATAEPQAPPASFGEALERMTERARNGEPLDPDSLGPAEPADQGELSLAERRLLGQEGSPAVPGPTRTPPSPEPPPVPAPLPPMLGTVVVEVAAKICAEGVQHPTGAWGCVLLADWHRDPHLSALIQTWSMLRVLPQGERSLACLTPKAWDWLAHDNVEGFTFHVVDGKPAIGVPALQMAQRKLMGSTPLSGATYFTKWLNPPADPPPAGDGEAGDGAASALSREDAGSMEPQPSPAEPRRLTAVERALLAAYGQLDQQTRLLQRLRSGATQAHKAEIDQVTKLTENVRELCRANLPEGTV